MNFNTINKCFKRFKPDNGDKIRITNLTHELSQFLWNFDIFDDLNGRVRYFSQCLNKIYTKNCPLKIKNVSRRRLSKPWLTDEILDLVRLKYRYFNRYKRGIISKASNNVLKNQCKSIIRRARRNYYHEYFQNHRNDMKRYRRTGGSKRERWID